MDKKQIRPYTLEEEKILREGLDETLEVTYENVATLSVEDPFANLKIEGFYSHLRCISCSVCNGNAYIVTEI